MLGSITFFGERRDDYRWHSETVAVVTARGRIDCSELLQEPKGLQGPADRGAAFEKAFRGRTLLGSVFCGFSSEQLRKSGSTMLTAGSVSALQSSKKRSMCLKWCQQRQAPRG